jgi:hypothetical protein
MFFMEAIVNPKPPGSRLDADHPENGVLIPRRNTSADGDTAQGTFGGIVGQADAPIVEEAGEGVPAL